MPVIFIIKYEKGAKEVIFLYIIKGENINPRKEIKQGFLTELTWEETKELARWMVDIWYALYCSQGIS